MTTRHEGEPRPGTAGESGPDTPPGGLGWPGELTSSAEASPAGLGWAPADVTLPAHLAHHHTNQVAPAAPDAREETPS